jgi:hypothetical protein
MLPSVTTGCLLLQRKKMDVRNINIIFLNAVYKLALFSFSFGILLSPTSHSPQDFV